LEKERCCLAGVIELLKSHRIKPWLGTNGRWSPIEVEFSGRLRPLQQDALDAFAQHDEGILCAPTVLASGSRSMVDCVTEGEHIDFGACQQLLDQWHARLAMFSSSRQVNRQSGEGWPKQRLCDIAILPRPTTRKG